METLKVVGVTKRVLAGLALLVAFGVVLLGVATISPWGAM
jgi:hypothetical protein